MAHCVDFWEKWKREPNFCGLGESTARSYDLYLKFTEKLAEENKIPLEIIYRNVPQTAIKSILRYKDNSNIKKEVSKAIIEALNEKCGITGKYIETIMGKSEPTKLKEGPKVIIPPLSEPQIETLKKNDVRNKVRLLNSILTKGQMNVLFEIVKNRSLDNEYDALSLSIKWASERIKNERATP